ncbi:hypothetical protein TL08_19245 [Actinoalloteichus hymeniacidonis]|uniref:Uncharacterized protein n=1 Tax=Actinoalloteichus hymeniacidonis TaxID=340345 RepID=A0AAC9HUA9_9PSEU|nr:hypothetical protein TL08_19245 [Actinoalloteichus hymeniacidonis]
MRFFYVRTLGRGDTHLADARHGCGPEVVPVCDPRSPFRPLNRTPLQICFYDWQPCAACLAAHHEPTPVRHLAVAR